MTLLEDTKVSPFADRQAPYVLSADLAEVFQEWGRSAKITVPSREFLAEKIGRIEKALSLIFNTVYVVEDDAIINGFKEACAESVLLIVSIDRVYAPRILGEGFASYLDVTRAVNEQFEPEGLISRIRSWSSPHTEVRSLQEAVDKLPNSHVGRDVALMDDVVFSGGTISKIISALDGRGISVKKVIAGVSIGQSKAILAANNIDLKSIRHFDEVIDEVCCRDFVVGAPYGGRSIIVREERSAANRSGLSLKHAPYILPFGNPEAWATIPKESVLSFSLDMLDVSSDIWLKMEEINGRKFSTRELGSHVYGLPERDSVTAAIQELKRGMTL